MHTIKPGTKQILANRIKNGGLECVMNISPRGNKEGIEVD